MQKLLRFFRDTWQELGRSIIVGDRYKKNVRGVAVGAAMIVAINLITGTMNLKNGYSKAAISSLILIIAGLLIIYLLLVAKKRDLALTIAAVAFSIIYTYDAVTVSDGIVIFWTLLFPWAFCYLSSVKSGIVLSVYFSAVYILLFYTPINAIVQGKYPDIIIQRFPILYIANAFLCIFIMVQYHKNTLHQMDYAEQLLEAKVAADKANSAKGDFLANMSHEIRTPINAVLGMNEMILRESRQASVSPDTDPQSVRAKFENINVYASDVESAGHNLLAIINDILDFSKIEAGRMDLVEAPYQLSSVLNDVSNMILFKARDKGLEFVVDVDENLPDNLHGDEVRVRQVITNILNNAVKYTEHGSVRLKLRGERSGEDRLTLVAAVRDTGIGIREEDLKKLFTKFQRLDLEQNSTVEGTGLGLAITHSLLDMMHGTINVESEYGKGSVFTVRIPQKIVSAEPMGDFQKRFESNVLEAKAYHESFRAPEAKILIVDDTKMNLTVAVNLLKSTQIHIDTAGSGEEAIDLAKSKAYDVILMDQRMPEMDGTETLHHIREIENGPNGETPVICLTADAVIGAKERYMAEGFSNYLTKPINSAALEKMLIKYLPEDKVIIVHEEESGESSKTAAEQGPDVYAPLRAAGMDPQVGLQYCQNDAEFYRSLLAEYSQGAAEKTANIKRFYEAEDWKNYGVLAHALKSTSRMIGVADLADAAAGLEAAANAENADKIREGHDWLMERYAAVCGAISEFLPPSETSTDAVDEVMEFAPGGDVMEFAPDEDVLEFAPDDEVLEFSPQ